MSGLFWKFAERMSAQLVSAVVTIILARLLLPEDYGAISLVTIFITLANVFVSDGFGAALIQKKEADNTDFSTVFYFGIVFSLVLYAFMFIFIAPWVADFYRMPILIPVLRVLAIKLPIAAINSVQQAYVSRHMIFKHFFFATLIGTIVSAFVGIAMAYLGFGVWALVAQYLTNTIIDTIVLWITVPWKPEFAFSISRLKGLFQFGWKLLLQSLLVSFYGNIRSLTIGKVYSAQDLAYYDKGSYYPNLIVVNVDTAMSGALFPAMSKEQQCIQRVKEIARRATKLSSYIMSPLLIGFAACAESFVLVLLTEKWMPMVPFLRIICVNLLFRAAQTATLQSIKAIGRSDLVLKMDIPVRIFGLASLFVAMKFGVMYIAISEVMVGLFGLILYSNVCGRVVGYKPREVWRDFGINSLQALIMGTVVWFLGKNLPFPTFIILFVQILLGGIIYIVISIVCKNENFFYLFKELRSITRK